MYIYESHLGSLYVSDYALNEDYLYCEQCGDFDWCIGCAETRAEAWELLKDETNTFDKALCINCPHAEDYDYCDHECENYKHCGGWDYNYVQEFLKNWDE